MSIKSNKLLLALMILALVITPMRSAWAVATPADSDTTPHCAQMDMPASEQLPDSAADTGHQCKFGCNGDCCDSQCSGCSHILFSLLNSVAVLQNIPVTP
ncbi:MAG: hypothetical protein WBO34_14305, partial [Gammaproteobacteria bacterium]